MNAIEQALEKLNEGEVVAYPSEGVWALGCDPKNEIAVRELLRLKKRPLEKGLILVGANLKQMEPYIEVKKYQTKLMTKWPGAHTWVVPTKATPPWIRGRHTSVALRVSNHPVISSLCKLFGGAIVSSSANLEGDLPARSINQVLKFFNGIASVEGNLGSLKGATPIQDVETDEWIRAPE